MLQRFIKALWQLHHNVLNAIVQTFHSREIQPQYRFSRRSTPREEINHSCLSFNNLQQIFHKSDSFRV